MNRSPARATLWHNPSFLALWSARMVSSLSDQVWGIGLPWLVYDLTGSAANMAGVAAFGLLPRVLFGLLAGVFADRKNVKGMLAVAVLVQMAIISFVIMSHAVDSLSVWTLYLVSFVLNAAGRFYSIGNATLVPQTVPQEQLTQANSQMSLGASMARLLGPGLAGLLIANLGLLLALAIGAASLLVPATALNWVRVPSRKTDVAYESLLLHELTGGIRFIAKHVQLRLALLFILLQNIGQSGIVGLMMYFAREDLNLAVVETGWVLTAVTVGHILASLLAPPLAVRMRSGTLILTGALVSSLSSLFVAFSDNWWQLAFAYGIMSGSAAFTNLHLITAIQYISPREMLGRVHSSSLVFGQLTTAPAVAIAGAFASVWGSVPVIFACSLLSCCAAFIGWMTSVRNWEARKSPQDSAA